MSLFPLRRARPGCGAGGKLIALKDNHLFEMIGKRACRCQPTDPGADHDCPLTKVRTRSRNPITH
jgi:hypothetical protein